MGKSRPKQKRRRPVDDSNLSFLVANKCAGLSKKIWLQVVQDVQTTNPLQQPVDAATQYCFTDQSHRRAYSCLSQLCPQCYRRRMHRVTRKLQVAIERQPVGFLYAERDSVVLPALQIPYLEQKAKHQKSPVNWQLYDPAELVAQLDGYRHQEHDKLHGISLKFTPRPRGTLATWYIWPHQYGWYLTRVRFALFPPSAKNIKSRVQRRARFMASDNVSVSDLSPKNLFNILVGSLAQPGLPLTTPLRVDNRPTEEYNRLLMPLSLLLPPPRDRVSHLRSTGIFRQPVLQPES